MPLLIINWNGYTRSDSSNIYIKHLLTVKTQHVVYIISQICDQPTFQKTQGDKFLVMLKKDKTADINKEPSPLITLL